MKARNEIPGYDARMVFGAYPVQPYTCARCKHVEFGLREDRWFCRRHRQTVEDTFACNDFVDDGHEDLA